MSVKNVLAVIGLSVLIVTGALATGIAIGFVKEAKDYTTDSITYELM